jgi:hypothetical protein
VLGACFETHLFIDWPGSPEKEAIRKAMQEHCETIRRNQTEQEQEQNHRAVMHGEGVFEDIYGFFAPIDCGETHLSGPWHQR